MTRWIMKRLGVEVRLRTAQVEYLDDGAITGRVTQIVRVTRTVSYSPRLIRWLPKLPERFAAKAGGS